MNTQLSEQRTVVLTLQNFIPAVIEQFLFDRKAGGLRETTIKFYGNKLDTFQKYLESRAIKYLEQITAKDLREFLLYLEATGHNPGGIHAHFRTIRTLLVWAEREELAESAWNNPIKKVKAPRVDIQPLAPVEMDDVKKLLTTCGNNFTGLRDKALILMLLDSACRANEILALNKNDVDMLSGAIIIRTSKNRRPRTSFIGKTALKALRAYLRSRTENNPALWVQQNNSRLVYFGLRAMLTRRASKAALGVTWLPHSFRRAAALEMLRNGADVFSLQAIGGWSDLQVMKRYLRESSADLQAVHSRTSPADSL
jgi:site-specific recombinase XerD